MKALDTNVLIRFLVRDDEQQANVIYGIFKQHETKIDLPDLVIAASAKFSGCESILTFDKKASHFPFFELLTNMPS